MPGFEWLEFSEAYEESWFVCGFPTHGVRYFVGAEFGQLKVECIRKTNDTSSFWEELHFPDSFEEGMDWLVTAYITGVLR
jgi:hypothetical protein